MTVNDLIETLKDMPIDADVYLAGDEELNYVYDYFDVYEDSIDTKTNSPRVVICPDGSPIEDYGDEE